MNTEGTIIRQEVFRRYSLWGQLGFWLFFWFSSFMQGITRGDNLDIAVAMSLLFTSFYALPIYVNYLILIPNFLEKQKHIIYVLSFLMTAIVAVWVYLEISTYIVPSYATEKGLFGPWVFFLPYMCLFMATTSLFRFAERWFENLKIQENLKSNKLQAELSFLKAQIQPHFLFNTLNNIYSYAYMQHPDTPEMITNLSSILRYIVYDSKAEKVPLEKELKIIHTLVALYKVKNPEQENIIIETSNIRHDHIITPLLLVSLVENALKHSNALEDSQGFIYLDIWASDDHQLIFSLKNSLKPYEGPSLSEKKGIGNKNITRQLELIYPNQYSLDTSIAGNEFHQTLTLQIETKKLHELQSAYS